MNQNTNTAVAEDTILDRVYNAFSNLEEGYENFEGSRADYVRYRFGGDINVGSIIILDAIRSEGLEKGLEETPDRIEKISYIKDIFTQIQNVQDTLDSLQSFDFSSCSNFGIFKDTLLHMDTARIGQVYTTQAELYKKEGHPIHYRVTPSEATSVSFKNCNVLRAYNANMAGRIHLTYEQNEMTIVTSKKSSQPTSEVEIGKVYRLAAGNRLRPIAEEVIKKFLK